MHPFRPFIQGYYGRIMDTLIRDELEQRFCELKDTTAQPNGAGTEKRPGTRSVVTLAIEAYMSANKHSDLTKHPKVEEHFARYASYQI